MDPIDKLKVFLLNIKELLWYFRYLQKLMIIHWHVSIHHKFFLSSESWSCSFGNFTLIVFFLMATFEMIEIRLVNGWHNILVLACWNVVGVLVKITRACKRNSVLRLCIFHYTLLRSFKSHRGENLIVPFVAWRENLIASVIIIRRKVTSQTTGRR